MPANPAINDGSVYYGSVVLTINAVTYVADDFEITYPTKIIERTNEFDEPEAQVAVPGFVTGSATLQLETSSTAVPTVGQTFTHNAVDYFISEVGAPQSKADYCKVRISFRKKYNA